MSYMSVLAVPAVPGASHGSPAHGIAEAGLGGYRTRCPLLTGMAGSLWRPGRRDNDLIGIMPLERG